MASPTKQTELIRGRKKAKALKARQRRVRLEMAKLAKKTDKELRRFIPGALASDN